MRKKLIAAVVVLAVVIAVLGLMNRSEESPALLTISQGDTAAAVEWEDVDIEEFTLTTVNGKGMEKTCEYRGIRLSELLSGMSFELNDSSVITITAEDNFSADFTGKEVLKGDNIFLAVERDGEPLLNLDENGPGAMSLAAADKNSKRCVKCIKTISISD